MLIGIPSLRNYIQKKTYTLWKVLQRELGLIIGDLEHSAGNKVFKWMINYTYLHLHFNCRIMAHEANLPYIDFLALWSVVTSFIVDSRNWCAFPPSPRLWMVGGGHRHLSHLPLHQWRVDQRLVLISLIWCMIYINWLWVFCSRTFSQHTQTCIINIDLETSSLS